MDGSDRYGRIYSFLSNYFSCKVLLVTGDTVLAKGCHWYDNFWTRCSRSRCRGFQGESYLGHILMKIREQCQMGGRNA